MVSNAHTRREEADGVITVIIDRDAKLNAISPEVVDALARAVDELSRDDDLRALIIAAEGRYFTAGIDVTAPMPATVAHDAPNFRALYRQYHRLYEQFEAVEKPVVLAAQGPCLGAGVEMACSCDFRFAAETASFQLPEVGLGTIPGSGGISRLTRLVGVPWAKWMAMAGRPVDAQQALRIGLVHDVLPAADFLATVQAVVREIVTLPREALGAAKVAIDMTADLDRASGRQLERLVNSQLVFGDEFRRTREGWTT
jgi:enoyl-CoA hydratase